MSTPVTPATPAPKVSWLKKLGLDILKVLNIISPLEKVAEPIVEAFLPITTIGFNLFDYLVGQAVNVEAGYAAITSAPTGVAKFNTLLPIASAALDQWVQVNMPGSAEILKADSYIQAKTIWATNEVNNVVAFLNSLPVAAGTVTSPAAVSTAAVIKQLAKANPGLAASVTTGKKS